MGEKRETNLRLVQLSKNDGPDVYEMLMEIGPEENGFTAFDPAIETYAEFLKKHDDASKGIGLNPSQVPQTVYWAYLDGLPIGMAKLRQCGFDEPIAQSDGHIGISIRPSQRKKGYGTALATALLQKAKETGISQIVATINKDNRGSIRTIKKNGGILDGETSRGQLRFFVTDL
jgi:predicted acetyltransferase